MYVVDEATRVLEADLGLELEFVDLGICIEVGDPITLTVLFPKGTLCFLRPFFDLVFTLIVTLPVPPMLLPPPGPFSALYSSIFLWETH